MKYYVIEVQHSAKTITSLSKAQYVASFAARRTVQVLVSLICILFGARLIGNIKEPFHYLFLAYGCLSLVFLNLPARARAEKIIQAIQKNGGHYPCSVIEFEEDFFCASTKNANGSQVRHKYAQCHKLMDYQDSYYYFISKEAAFMFPHECIEPTQRKDFKAFLEKKTGLSFQTPNHFWNASIWSVLSARRNTR